MEDAGLCLLAIIIIFIACRQAWRSSKATHSSKSNSMNHGIADVNGIKMYYETYGAEKPVLVLIHGGGSTIQTSFANIIPLLENSYTLIAMDLQAHGRTSDRGIASSFEQDADDVAALLKQLGIPGAAFFGFSNGASTAMQIAVRHPELVYKLVLASPFYKREGMMQGFFEFMENARLDNMPKQLQEAFLALTPDREKLQLMHDRDKNRMVEFKDWSDETLRSIKVPVQLIFADKDVMTADHAVQMYHLFPKAQLVILPGTHGAYMGELTTLKPGSRQTEFTASLIHEFLSN